MLLNNIYTFIEVNRSREMTGHVTYIIRSQFHYHVWWSFSKFLQNSGLAILFSQFFLQPCLNMPEQHEKFVQQRIHN